MLSFFLPKSELLLSHCKEGKGRNKEGRIDSCISGTRVEKLAQREFNSSKQAMEGDWENGVVCMYVQ